MTDEAEFWELEVPPRFAGMRVDQYLAAQLPELSRSYIQKLIDEGGAKLDGQVVRRSQRVANGQIVEFTVPETQDWDVLPEEIPLAIVHDDPDLLVVDKPVGMVVHPNMRDRSGTLVNALLWNVRDLSGINGIERPGIVHRIDKDTSGLLVVAKNDLAHHHLGEQFRDHSIERLYVALCWGGVPTPPEGTVRSFIGRDPRDRKRMASVTGGGKEAVTHYRTTERYGAANMIECSLDTGRTHQIRVHLSEQGHPLVGDSVYGGTKARHLGSDPAMGALLKDVRGQMLHAATLGFIHPRTDQYLRFRCPPPPPMVAVIRALRTCAGLDPDMPGPWDREDPVAFGRTGR